MKQRIAILAATLALAPLPAVAADLAVTYPLPEVAAPECARYGYTRPYDDVYQPPQTAYILAQRCQSFDIVGLLTPGGPREKLLVYYNGGSMYKTDIDLLVVPR